MKRGCTKNAERNAEIIRRRKAGEWPRAIARSMGLSHNVVIGVCGRAGLSSPAGNLLVARGEENPVSKLTDDAVRTIRSSHEPGLNRWNRGNTRALAARFGCTVESIRDVVARRTWAHVT